MKFVTEDELDFDNGIISKELTFDEKTTESYRKEVPHNNTLCNVLYT